MRVLYVLEVNNKLRQLAKEFGRQKRVVVKYNLDFKYVHIYDNRNGAKYPGITLGYDEFQELKNIVELMDTADSFFKAKSLPSEVFKKRAGGMQLEQMTALTPDPPQNDMPAVQAGKNNSNEHLSRPREEQQREECPPLECEEQQPRREENLPPEEDSRREVYLPRERGSEGQDRERGHLEHVVPESVDEGEISNADILLEFLKTIGDFNMSTPDYMSTPTTTDAKPNESATNVTPQVPTTADDLIPTTSTHICGEEEVYAIPVSFFKPAIIPTPPTSSYATNVTPQVPTTADDLIPTTSTPPDTEPHTTTDAKPTESATNVTPQVPTTADDLIPTTSTHIRGEEKVYAIPVGFFKPPIIPTPPTYSYAPVVEPISPEVKRGLKMKKPLFKKRPSFPYSSD